MLTAVVQDEDKHSACSPPRLVGFPDILVLIGRRVIAQAASAGIDGFFDLRARVAGIAGDRA